MADVGELAPEFTLPDQNGDEVSPGALRPAGLVLYFYPRDDTPGCTAEALDFSAALTDFAAAGVRVFGISRDPLSKHRKFTDKHGLSVPLLSDETGEVCEAYGVWVEKNMYGRKSMGIERSTFLIDGKGVIRRVWRKVRVAGHVEEVLAAAQSQETA